MKTMVDSQSDSQTTKGTIVSGPRQNAKQALFALSGNQCAFSDCDAVMYMDGSIVGEICHIRAQRPGGPRYDERFTDTHEIANLILLCSTHHKLIDDHAEEYGVERLLEMKRRHESRHRSRQSPRSCE